MKHRTASINKYSSPGRHSLPRKKVTINTRDTYQGGQYSPNLQIQRGGTQFNRNGLSQIQIQHRHQHNHCHVKEDSSFEYFVPRSVSDFNLTSDVQDIAVTLPQSVLKNYSTVTSTSSQINTPIICAPSATSRQDNCGTIGTRSREKMVTFEDEGCPGSTPTRKIHVPNLDNVFM
ncbi:uncharacterized protein LOC135168219 [Diachasmimorpha longicaudata]|uniref:uncharacterized protein LOC135168219 n=1 Tax=Diachasmimorpha longicaudata TaxID=58733 RepID=UPI0030B87DED